MSDPRVFLEIINLSKEYHLSLGNFNGIKSRRVALKNVSLEILTGECLAVVGESGSGKTTLGRCLLRLVQPDRGRVVHHGVDPVGHTSNGVDLLQLPEKQFRYFRTKFQMIFQDASQALNPRQTVGASLKEPLKVHGGYRKQELLSRVQELLFMVGLDAQLNNRFPHELSGGQRQRVAIARALATRPIFVVADEPTSSLDASLKGQVIDLLIDLRQRLGLTLLLISHDIAMVSHASNRIAVMYHGTLVEVAPTDSLMDSPVHPYSKLLIESANHNVGFKSALKQNGASNGRLGPTENQGCEFSHRCPWAEALCLKERPPLRNISDGHLLACHLAERPGNILNT